MYSSDYAQCTVVGWDWISNLCRLLEDKQQAGSALSLMEPLLFLCSSSSRTIANLMMQIRAGAPWSAETAEMHHSQVVERKNMSPVSS
jgi:hypothetical protein